MILKIKYKTTAPLSHIGETKSTGSYFNMVPTCYGEMPAVTANHVRGRIRNEGAYQLCSRWGIVADKAEFHALFSGGNLDGTMKNDIEKSLKVRKVYPLISMLGAGLGDIIMAGSLIMTFAFPVCKESAEITKKLCDSSWRKMMGTIEFTRMDDSKNDRLSKFINDLSEEKTSKASTQMRYKVHCMAIGSELWQKIILPERSMFTDLEEGALLSSIISWFENPTLGGMAAKGFGYFDADINDGMITVSDGEINVSSEYQEKINKYYDFLDKNKPDSEQLKIILPLLKGAVKKDGKKSNETSESDGETD